MRGRFPNLDQTHSECARNSVEILLQAQILSPNSIEDQKEKKILIEIWRDFVPILDWK